VACGVWRGDATAFVTARGAQTADGHTPHGLCVEVEAFAFDTYLLLVYNLYLYFIGKRLVDTDTSQVTSSKKIKTQDFTRERIIKLITPAEACDSATVYSLLCYKVSDM